MEAQGRTIAPAIARSEQLEGNRAKKLLSGSRQQINRNTHIWLAMPEGASAAESQFCG